MKSLLDNFSRILSNVQVEGEEEDRRMFEASPLAWVAPAVLGTSMTVRAGSVAEVLGLDGASELVSSAEVEKGRSRSSQVRWRNRDRLLVLVLSASSWCGCRGGRVAAAAAAVSAEEAIDCDLAEVVGAAVVVVVVDGLLPIGRLFNKVLTMLVCVYWTSARKPSSPEVYVTVCSRPSGSSTLYCPIVSLPLLNSLLDWSTSELSLASALTAYEYWNGLA